jgi:hypothetical protein
MAEVPLYVARLADRLGVDLVGAAKGKLRANAGKYLVEKARGECEVHGAVTRKGGSICTVLGQAGNCTGSARADAFVCQAITSRKSPVMASGDFVACVGGLADEWRFMVWSS